MARFHETWVNVDVARPRPTASHVAVDDRNARAIPVPDTTIGIVGVPQNAVTRTDITWCNLLRRVNLPGRFAGQARPPGCRISHQRTMVQPGRRPVAVQPAAAAPIRLGRHIAAEDAVRQEQLAVGVIVDAAPVIARAVAADEAANHADVAAVVHDAAAPPLAPVVRDDAVDERRGTHAATVHAGAVVANGVAVNQAVADRRTAFLVVDAAAATEPVRLVRTESMATRDREAVQHRGRIRSNGRNDVVAVVVAVGIADHVVRMDQQAVVAEEVSAQDGLIGHDVALVWLALVQAGVTPLQNDATLESERCGDVLGLAVCSFVRRVYALGHTNLAARRRHRQCILQVYERIDPAHAIVRTFRTGVHV